MAGLLLIAAAALVGIRSHTAGALASRAPGTAPQAYQLNPTEVETVKPQDLQQVVQVTGSLSPVREAILAAPVAATIKTVPVQNGQAVNAGDVVVRFNTIDLQAQLNQQRQTMQATQAQLTLAQATLKRDEGLAQRGVITQAEVEQAQASAAALKAQVGALQAQVGTAEHALANAVVKAPFDGWISGLSVAAGERVATNATLATVVDLSKMEVQANVPVSDVARIAVGQHADLKVEGIPGRTFGATVDRINPVTIQGTGAIPVYLSVANIGHLRGGMFVSGNIITKQASGAIAVPPQAVRHDQQGSYVLDVSDGKANRQAVSLGNQ